MGVPRAGAMGFQFGAGSHDNSVCPSLACLDVKMYNFLNSEACICNVQDLHHIRDLGAGAQTYLNKAIIGGPLRFSLQLGVGLSPVQAAGWWAGL